MRLGKNIQLIRKNLGYTQEEFAEFMNMTRGRMQSYEQDKVEPPLRFLLYMEEITEIPIYEIITRELTMKELKNKAPKDKVTTGMNDLYNYNTLVSEVTRLRDQLAEIDKKIAALKSR